jgi:hypothetical protein
MTDHLVSGMGGQTGSDRSHTAARSQSEVENYSYSSQISSIPNPGRLFFGSAAQMRCVTPTMQQRKNLSPPPFLEPSIKVQYKNKKKRRYHVCFPFIFGILHQQVKKLRMSPLFR